MGWPVLAVMMAAAAASEAYAEKRRVKKARRAQGKLAIPNERLAYHNPKALPDPGEPVQDETGASIFSGGLSGAEAYQSGGGNWMKVLNGVLGDEEETPKETPTIDYDKYNRGQGGMSRTGGQSPLNRSEAGTGKESFDEWMHQRGFTPEGGGSQEAPGRGYERRRPGLYS